MRNLITILLFILTFFQSYGKDIWSCADFDADVKTYSEIANQWKSSGNKKWAKKLLEAFPISSDNTINTNTSSIAIARLTSTISEPLYCHGIRPR